MIADPGPDDPGFAPAKINLCLHVTGRRADGYHLLDSLVAFAADVGDRLTVASPAVAQTPHQRPDHAPATDTDTQLALVGPEAAVLAADPDNLVLRAARAFGPGLPPARITLDKRLPVASGIGGGSADAAAALRLLSRHWARPVPSPAAVLALGADVPVCLVGRVARMRGIGDQTNALLAPLPPVWAVLANPRRPVATPQVFKALNSRDNPPLPDALPRWADARALARWLDRQRNDLEAPARLIEPEISTVLQVLATRPGCLIARMSGSGATCFGLFATPTQAMAAARAIARAQPGWWVASSALI